MNDEEFLKLLKCIVCGGKIDKNSKNGSLVCRKCGRYYPVIDGIVDLYLPEKDIMTQSVNIKNQYEIRGEFKHELRTEKERIDITVELAEGDNLLEIGCAGGEITANLSKKIANVVASDISLTYLKKAKKNAPSGKFVRLDIHNLPFDDESFDCVVCTEVLEHVYSPYKALDEIHRILKPKGSLILSVPNNMTFSRIFGHLMKRKEQYISLDKMDMHINFFDTGSILELLRKSGYYPVSIMSANVPLPIIGKYLKKYSINFLTNIIRKRLLFFSDPVIVKAKKEKVLFWDKFNENLKKYYKLD
jgi:ubiquinone/menaquinone biosynthesis C-methylase UbiE